MSINIGLSAAQLTDYWRMLWSPHRIKIDAHILDLNHNFLQDVSDRFVSGQVNFDVNQDVTRTASISLADPDKSLAIYGGYETYMKRMVQLYYSISDPMGAYWYTTPVFCGPITNFDQDEIFANINLAGKDSLAYGSVWNPKTFPKGTLVTDIIRWILVNQIGENRFNIPNSGKKVTKDYAMQRDAIPWKALKQLYSMLGYVIFFDGRGDLQYRTGAGDPVAGFANHQLLSKPKVAFSPEGFANSVWVEGGDPKGDKTIVRGFAELYAAHPFSAYSLGRNDVPRYYTKQVSDSSIVDPDDAANTAVTELLKSIYLNINAQWDGVPYPLLEEYDVYQIATPELYATFRFNQGTLPLTHDATMSMGYSKKVANSVIRKRVRRKGKKYGHEKKPKKGGKK